MPLRLTGSVQPSDRRVCPRLRSRNQRVEQDLHRESRLLLQSTRLLPWIDGFAEDRILGVRRRQRRSLERFPCPRYTWNRGRLFGRGSLGLESQPLQEVSYHHWVDRSLRLRPPLLSVPVLYDPPAAPDCVRRVPIPQNINADLVDTNKCENLPVPDYAILFAASSRAYPMDAWSGERADSR